MLAGFICVCESPLFVLPQINEATYHVVQLLRTICHGHVTSSRNRLEKSLDHSLKFEKNACILICVLSYLYVCAVVKLIYFQFLRVILID